MAKNVILLNGPPFSGKDTIANMIEENYGAEHLRFKTKLYEITALINNIELNTFIDYATKRETKDSNIPGMDFTPRQLLIETSEDVIKPHYGKDYFGVVVGDSIYNSDSELFVISDSGFIDELLALIRGAKLKGDNVTVIKLFRDGCSFENDSRDYLPEKVLMDNNIKVLNLYNNVEMTELEKYVSTLYDYIKK